jgi:4-hydroxy-tetrahydrodipicolinate synthase
VHHSLSRYCAISCFQSNSRISSGWEAKFYPVFKDLFIETNPVPVKAALAMLGLCEEQYRLPLVPMSAKNRDVLKATLKACGVLK